jgi:uncharacterized membrane protein YbhN (UPF0104 family)
MGVAPPISVVIPAHNEQDAVVQQIQAVDGVMSATGRDYEIIVVDDGSTDDTALRASLCGVKIIRLDRNHGYGFALKAGIAQAQFDWILIIDADLTYPVAAIPRLLERIPEHDMAVGARAPGGAANALTRRPAKWLLRHYAGYTVGQNIPDLNSGMRVMRKSVIETFLHLLPSGFSFTSTITLSMLANGYKVHYEPIEYFKRVGHSKIRPKDFFRIFALITRLMMLFNPTRALLPLGALALMLGVADFRFDVIPIDSGAGLASAGGLLCVWGMMAEHKTRQAVPQRPSETALAGAASWPWRRIGVSALLLLALAYALPREKLLEATRRVHWQTLAIAIPMFIAIHCLGAWKWLLLVNCSGASFSLRQSLRFYFAGLFGNLFLPSVAGGDIVMVGMAFRRSESRAGILIGSLVNRVLDLIALALLVGAAAIFSPAALNADSARILQVGVLGALVVAGALALAALLIDPNRLPAKLGDLYRKQRGAIQSLRNPRFVAAPLVLSVLMQLFLLLLTAWIASASGFQIPIHAWLLAWPLAKLVALLPITLAGIGARELALTALLAPFGVEPEQTMIVGLAWVAVMVGGSLAGGAIAKALAERGESIQE